MKRRGVKQWCGDVLLMFKSSLTSSLTRSLTRSLNLSLTLSLTRSLNLSIISSLMLVGGCERASAPIGERRDELSVASLPTDQLKSFDALSAETRQPHNQPHNQPHVQLRALFAATRATSPLMRGVLQQLRGGESLGISLAINIDDAHLAARDGLVLGALRLELSQSVNRDAGERGLGGRCEQRDDLSRHRLASSELWWASRGGARAVEVIEWRELIMGKRSHWSSGERFQLCLRAYPDPLERLWSEAHPTLAPALERARASGQWPVFDTDEQLIAHLNAHPGAVALFPVGNLRLWGAPLSRVSIRGHHAPRVVASFELVSARRQSEASTALGRALQTQRRLDQLIASLNDQAERASLVREWGWEP